MISVPLTVPTAIDVTPLVVTNLVESRAETLTPHQAATLMTLPKPTVVPLMVKTLNCVGFPPPCWQPAATALPVEPFHSRIVRSSQTLLYVADADAGPRVMSLPLTVATRAPVP